MSFKTLRPHCYIISGLRKSAGGELSNNSPHDPDIPVTPPTCGCVDGTDHSDKALLRIAQRGTGKSAQAVAGQDIASANQRVGVNVVDLEYVIKAGGMRRQQPRLRPQDIVMQRRGCGCCRVRALVNLICAKQEGGGRLQLCRQQMRQGLCLNARRISGALRRRPLSFQHGIPILVSLPEAIRWCAGFQKMSPRQIGRISVPEIPVWENMQIYLGKSA